jgi:hypothetical protein
MENSLEKAAKYIKEALIKKEIASQKFKSETENWEAERKKLLENNNLLSKERKQLTDNYFIIKKYAREIADHYAYQKSVHIINSDKSLKEIQNLKVYIQQQRNELFVKDGRTKDFA